MGSSKTAFQLKFNSEFNMDNSRYKELIKLEKNNSLSDDQFFEWVKYGAMVESQVIYNRKQKYFLLIDKYCNRQISYSEFQSLFSLTEKEQSAEINIIYDDIENFNFNLADDVLKISDLITKISLMCVYFNEPYDTKYEMEKAEILFYSLVKKHYLKLQKLLSISSNYEKLIFRSFKMLISILGTEILIIFLYILWANT